MGMGVSTSKNAKGDSIVSAPSEKTAARSPALVFVVDDELQVGELVEAFLKLSGYRTQLFQDPRAALAAMADAKELPDLLVTDYVMEGLNGIELVAQALRFKPGLKTILISGNISEHVLQKYATRPDYFLRKPFLSQKLLELVESLLGPAPQATPPDTAKDA